MPIQFGLLVTNQHPPSDSAVERFGQTIDQVRAARDLGFDLVVFGQHFLTTEFQMLQPAVALARLAAEAGSMRLGITIYLLPLLNPVAVAEETATLDVVTGGRFIFGAGLGYRDIEDRAFGLDRGERVARLVAHLETVRRLWAGEAVTYDGPGCRLSGARLLLRPVQQPHPPVWIAANSDAAVQRAAELGDTWVINPHATLETISRQMGLYRTALARVGKQFPSELPMMREVFVGESRAEAIRAARPHLDKKYQAYVQWGQHRALPKDDDMTQRFDDLVRDRFILGDPEDCAAEIRRGIEWTGATTLIFRLHWPGLSHEAVMRAMRLLSAKVRPMVG
jgi:alkanesulfonate monooxygenase SsuD/methylene tetrahydromethanopterin reductase-like flavin-dependent oxidoreductase (luciferase family)